MNWFKSPSQDKKPAPVDANPDWKTYRAGGGDRAGRRITEIYAIDDDYVIYFSDHYFTETIVCCELFYEVKEELDEDLGKADAALAKINRLLDDNQTKGNKEYNFNYSTLELAADALEMIFRDEKVEGLEILSSLCDKLQAKEETHRRLDYQAGALSVTLLAWILYLVLKNFGWFHPGWEPWFLAAALAMAGGFFSVCATIGSLEVNVNQRHWFLVFAGMTRAAVALLAGIAVLLAMRSKMFAGITYEPDKMPGIGDPLTIVEMFFCFLAGFSESLVPNILSKTADAKTAEQAKAAANKAAADAKAAAEAKAAADKAAAEKGPADKAAADKAAAEKAAADKAAADKLAGR